MIDTPIVDSQTHDPVEATSPDVSTWRAIVGRFLHHRMAALGLVVLVVLMIACFGAGWIAPNTQGEQDLLLGPTSPSAQHWFGTDQLGRDYFSEVLYAGRISLAVGLGVAVVSTAVGTLVGAIAGYVGGLVDELIMRITDLFLIVPAIAVLAVGLEALGQSTVAIVGVLATIGWTYIARVARSQALALREREFIHAAKGLGASPLRILLRHLLPNLVGVVAVSMSLGVATAIIIESTLSFLGFGVQPPAASWGSLLSAASGMVGTPTAYLLYFPGLFITVTVLSINFVGDGLRDAFDPQGKHL